YAIFKGITATTGKTKVVCTDGDASCDTDGAADGKCTLAPQGCLNNSGLPPCNPGDVQAISKHTANLLVPTTPSTTADDCADPSSVTVQVGTKSNGKPKPGKLTIELFADSSAKPKRDKNKIKLQCNPGGSTTSTTLPQTSCAANGNGNPNTVVT